MDGRSRNSNIENEVTLKNRVTRLDRESKLLRVEDDPGW